MITDSIKGSRLKNRINLMPNLVRGGIVQKRRQRYGCMGLCGSVCVCLCLCESVCVGECVCVSVRCYMDMRLILGQLGPSQLSYLMGQQYKVIMNNPLFSRVRPNFIHLLSPRAHSKHSLRDPAGPTTPGPGMRRPRQNIEAAGSDNDGRWTRSVKFLDF